MVVAAVVVLLLLVEVRIGTGAGEKVGGGVVIGAIEVIGSRIREVR